MIFYEKLMKQKQSSQWPDLAFIRLFGHLLLRCSQGFHGDDLQLFGGDGQHVVAPPQVGSEGDVVYRLRSGGAVRFNFEPPPAGMR